MPLFTHSFSHTLLLFTFIIIRIVTSEPTTNDKQALLSFISNVRHASRIQWRSTASVCSWTGVTCDSTNSSVTHLRLPGAELVGTIPQNTLGTLSTLRVLSLRSNALEGSLPSDFFDNLTRLRGLYLQNNMFSGKLPISVTHLTKLSRLDLSGNRFSGSLPFSINNLIQLTELMLQDNEFSGEIPSIINVARLVSINISNNRLNGSIPSSLSRFPKSAFSGNVNLCGKPLPPCGNKSFFDDDAPTPSPSSSIDSNSIEPKKKKKKKLSKGAIIAIAFGSALTLAALVSLFLYLLVRLLKRRRKQIQHPTSYRKPAPPVDQAGASSSKDDLTGGSIDEERKNKLVFFGGAGNNINGGVYGFDLEDLLQASAEVLGKGSFGTSYKAVLEEGTTVVVKRLKDVSVTKKEFESQMTVLGRIISNENVVPLRAFYYSKDEKLIVTDFMAAGSLSALLHGSRGSDRTPLDWDHRMRIALTAAKGVAHLHVVANVVHGNIKSSNVLLWDATNVDAFVSDYGLNTLFTKPSTSNHRGSGYLAPEVIEARKVTSKSDVYSFGVLLLELLTGKSPNHASLGEEGMDLPRWVQSVVREEWTAEVFDAELVMYNNIEEEMVQLLQIAMSCVSTVPDQRPAMQEVVKMMEEISRFEIDDGLRQSSDDPSKSSGGNTPPTETRSSPRDVTP